MKQAVWLVVDIADIKIDDFHCNLHRRKLIGLEGKLLVLACRRSKS